MRSGGEACWTHDRPVERALSHGGLALASVAPDAVAEHGPEKSAGPLGGVLVERRVAHVDEPRGACMCHGADHDAGPVEQWNRRTIRGWPVGDGPDDRLLIAHGAVDG